jgi:hypothetical protein
MKLHRRRVVAATAAVIALVATDGTALPRLHHDDRPDQVRSLLVQAQAVSNRGRLATAGHAELGEDVGDVEAGGLLGDEQRLADLPVRPALSDQGKNLGLARGEAKGFGLRMRCLGFGGDIGRLLEL